MNQLQQIFFQVTYYLLSKEVLCLLVTSHNRYTQCLLFTGIPQFFSKVHITLLHFTEDLCQYLYSLQERNGRGLLLLQKEVKNENSIQHLFCTESFITEAACSPRSSTTEWYCQTPSLESKLVSGHQGIDPCLYLCFISIYLYIC